MAEIDETLRRQIVRFAIEAGHSGACIASRRNERLHESRCICGRDAILRALKRPEDRRG